MRVGDASTVLPAPELMRREGAVGMRLKLEDRLVEATFRREGPVGGEAVVVKDGKAITHALREGVSDTYSGWRADDRYQRWVREPGFDFVIPEADRER